MIKIKYYKFLFPFFFITTTIACNELQNDYVVSRDTVEELYLSDTVSIENKNEVSVGDYANFIAGKPSNIYEEFQKTHQYRKYVKNIEEDWKLFITKQYNITTNWAKDNNIISSSDTTTVFYPFGGPDFAYLNIFYPYSKCYLLVGLENIGRIPTSDNFSDNDKNKLLESVSNSMSNFYQEGYFATELMKKNFRDLNISGIIHVLLFLITNTDNKVISCEYFEIDKFGDTHYVDFIEPLSKNIKGVKIKFTKNNKEKSLYYLQVDLSNDNFEFYPELATFVSKLRPENVLLKSASYLLHEDKLSLFSKMLQRQSSKIIQDDSGFPYSLLKQNKYSIQLYGNYSKTLNVFKDYWQQDLKSDYTKNKPKKLPFSFGYNVPFGATSIIVANAFETKKNEYPVYKVQLKMSWERLSEESFSADLPDIDYYFDEAYYKYTAGNCKTEEECREILKIAKELGYEDAFIIKFTDCGREHIGK